MQVRTIAVVLAFVGSASVSATSVAFAQLARIAPDALGVVPEPREVAAYAATYALPSHVVISAPAGTATVATQLAQFLDGRGITPSVVPSASMPTISLRLNPNLPQLQAASAYQRREGYTLDVTGHGVAIAAQSRAGLFYGIQTFEQLFPSQLGDETIHQTSIVDWPQYRWRGIHLDVSRHFFGVPVVERYIALAARYKLNVFHWHLTDDQGWRIAIRRYPRLTSVGGCRNGTQIGRGEVDGVRYCGFYTQAQIRQVVAFAAQRFVTIVPEIEMPGHTMAALAAYRQLACERGRYEVSETWGESGYDALCPTPYTFQFMGSVLDEVVSLFPSEYVHIGGDEVLPQAWRDSPFVRSLMVRLHLRDEEAVQAYFTRRIEAYLQSKGRRMIGWDEIAKAGVSKAATVEVWHPGQGPAIAASGNDVVLAPDGPLYFDAYQGDPRLEPLAIGGLTTPQMVYDYDPLAGVPERDRPHVLGIEGCLWTEFIPAPPHLFYMALPRELALAEIAWTPQPMRSWGSFVARSADQYAWLESSGYDFRVPNPSFQTSAPLVFANVSPGVQTVDAQTDASDVTLTISDPAFAAAIYYTTDGSLPSPQSTRYVGPLHLSPRDASVTEVTAVAVLPSGRISTPSEFILRRK